MASGRFGLVVGVDDVRRSAPALRWAARDAEQRNVPLTLVCTRPWLHGTRRAHRLVDDTLAVVDASCRAGGPPKVITKVVTLDSVGALVELSRDADLLVVGAAALGRRLAGRSHCAVAVVGGDAAQRPASSRATWSST